MFKIKLEAVEKIKEFVKIVSKFEADAYIRAGRYIIDAKSIMGIFSINLLEPVMIEFGGDGLDLEKLIPEYKKKLSEFIVEE